MFTAIKKLISHNDNQNGNSPPGMQTMAQSLQKKFSKGVQYNMKIIIKGDRNVGKTCLFYRLQGLKFKEDYMPTQEIQATSIQWNYKATDDVVKVEVWDVVDKGKKKKRLEGLKLDNVAAEHVMEEAALDAEFVDVYKNTNGVIMMIDMTKQWTFDYVQRELPKVPLDIPILVFANHRDMGHHRVTTEDDVHFFIEALNRPSDAAPIRYMEGSMRNSFGLKFLHKFFNLPFLQLQKQTLLQQLDTNRQETELTIQELDLLQVSEEQNYDLFMEAVNNKRRQIAEQLSPACSPAAPSSDTELPNGLAVSQSTHQIELASSESPVDKPISRSKSSPSCALPAKVKQQSKPTEAAVEVRVASPIVSGSSSSPVASPPPSHPQPNTFMSRLFKKGLTSVENNSKEDSSVVRENAIGLDHDPVKSVDDFVPDDHFDGSFLEDDRPSKVEADVTVDLNESESEEEGNPMVAGFQDDVDSDDNFQISLSGHSSKPHSDNNEVEIAKPSIAIDVTYATHVTSQVDRLHDDHSTDAVQSTTNVTTDAFRLDMSGEDEEDTVTSAAPVPFMHNLENEDLSILETSGLPKSSFSGNVNLHSPRRLSGSSNGESISDTTTSDTAAKTKKSKTTKPHRDKKSERRTKEDDNDKSDDRRGLTKKKHKKHRMRDAEMKTKKSSSSSSSKRASSTVKTSDNELEDFLNDGGGGGGGGTRKVVGRTSTVAASDAATTNEYESL